MSQIEILKNYILKENLIKDVSDIDFLFESYEYDDKKPLEVLIDDVIEWSYNNDSLETFYDEHWDVLENSESVIFLQGCDIKDQFALTWGYLYRYNSKSKYYYKIKAEGEHAGLIDTDGYLEVLDHQADESMINSFKDKCYTCFNLDGELSDDDLKHSSIDFYD